MLVNADDSLVLVIDGSKNRLAIGSKDKIAAKTKPQMNAKENLQAIAGDRTSLRLRAGGHFLVIAPLSGAVSQ